VASETGQPIGPYVSDASGQPIAPERLLLTVGLKLLGIGLLQKSLALGGGFWSEVNGHG
jgi:hypothetical protein